MRTYDTRLISLIPHLVAIGRIFLIFFLQLWEIDTDDTSAGDDSDLARIYDR